MKVRSVDPTVDTRALLAGAKHADAIRIMVEGTALDARRAADTVGIFSVLSDPSPPRRGLQ